MEGEGNRVEAIGGIPNVTSCWFSSLVRGDITQAGVKLLWGYPKRSATASPTSAA